MCIRDSFQPFFPTHPKGADPFAAVHSALLLEEADSRSGHKKLLLLKLHTILVDQTAAQVPHWVIAIDFPPTAGACLLYTSRCV